MEEQRYLISDAARMVAVESHVLRYWEEELGLSIGRTELGHRYYTRENIETFRNIKELKEKGLQLKAIKVVLQGLETRKREECEEGKSQENRKHPEDGELPKEENEGEKDLQETALAVMEDNAKKLHQFEILVSDIVDKVIKENNEDLQKQIEASFSREMDYLIRMQEANEEERFRKLDAAIRAHQKNGKLVAATREKNVFSRLFRKRN